MTYDHLNKIYFDWMYDLVKNERHLRFTSYRRLFDYLNNIEFVYIMEMDENRARDGINFRYRFGYEAGYTRQDIANYLDIKPCSVLEMMVALAFRCEEHIMDDPELGNRTGCWVWEMIDSLGLSSMDDEHFNEQYTENVINNFINREYARNGKGGLFTLHECKADLRDVDIWYQAMWYFSSILKT